MGVRGGTCWKNLKFFLRLDKEAYMMMRMIQERGENDIEEKKTATTMFLSKGWQTENMM